MRFSELIAKCGDDNVRFQILDQCASNFQKTKNGTMITFGTEQGFSLDGTNQLGLVVWLDRKRVKEIMSTTPHELPTGDRE